MKVSNSAGRTDINQECHSYLTSNVGGWGGVGWGVALSLFSHSDDLPAETQKKDEMILLLKRAKVPLHRARTGRWLSVSRRHVSCGLPAQHVSRAAPRSVWFPSSGRRSGSSDKQPAGDRLHLQSGNL